MVKKLGRNQHILSPSLRWGLPIHKRILKNLSHFARLNNMIYGMITIVKWYGIMSRILGIDPGLRITGWGMIDYDGYRLKHVAHGTIVTSMSEHISRRLNKIYQSLSDVIEEYSPHEAGIERVFVNMNPESSLKLGMARGTAICCAGVMKLPIEEYTPNAVKKAVVGIGHATKDQVAMMVQRLLNCGEVKADAADALAISICHAHHRVNYREAAVVS